MHTLQSLSISDTHLASSLANNMLSLAFLIASLLRNVQQILGHDFHQQYTVLNVLVQPVSIDLVLLQIQNKAHHLQNNNTELCSTPFAFTLGNLAKFYSLDT